jgi:hypothetical protein
MLTNIQSNKADYYYFLFNTGHIGNMFRRSNSP